MTIENIVWPDGMIRDWKFSNPLAAGQRVDSKNMEAVTLDLFIRNRGAAALTVVIEGMPAVTVDPNDVFTLNDTVMGLIQVVSGVAYDFFLTGVKYSTLKARRLM